MARLYSPMCGPRILVAKTCTMCFELKMADEYKVRGDGYRSTYCKICRSKRAGKINIKTNTDTLEKATKHHSRWTDSEIKEMWKLIDQGLSAREVAGRLGRSQFSVSSARHHNKR